MKSRIGNPALLLPEAMHALQALNATTEKAGLPPTALFLIQMRASQINGCSVCVDMHAKHMRKAGVSEERITAIGAWRDTPYYSDAERAVLALTESVTRLSDRSDPVPDEVWNEAARHFDEKALAGLLMAIASINVWNRLNVASRQIVGSVSW